jgi:putative transposase
MSERRACSVIAADRTVIRYRSRRPCDTALRGRLRELADARRRFGYSRLFILLRQDGEASGLNRIYTERWRSAYPPLRSIRRTGRTIGIDIPAITSTCVMRFLASEPVPLPHSVKWRRCATFQ